MAGKRGRPPGIVETKPRNVGSRRPFTDALNLAINRVIRDKTSPHNGKVALAAIAEELVTKAVAGDGFAIKEIADRLEGKPKQAIEHSSDPDNPTPTGLAVVFVKAKD